MKISVGLAAALCFMLAACTVDKQLTPTGGSKADGIVELSFELGGFQNARVDWASAQSQAISRCEAWGYRNAERFGGERRQCQFANQYGCSQWFITVNYQCTN